MIEDANDHADAQDVAERTDETFWFSFFYDSKSYGEPRKCYGPRGIFTARNVQTICETERELLARHYGKYCVAGGVEIKTTRSILEQLVLVRVAADLAQSGPRRFLMVCPRNARRINTVLIREEAALKF